MGKPPWRFAWQPSPDQEERSPALSTSASIAAWYVDAKTSRIATAQGRKDGNLPMSRRKNRSYGITTRRASNAYAGSVNNLWSVAVDRRMLGKRR